MLDRHMRERYHRVLSLSLKQAAQRGRIRDLTSLFSEDMLTSDDFGLALHMAAQNGHLKAVEKLLEAGANIEVSDENGYSLFDKLEQLSPEIIYRLQEYGVPYRYDQDILIKNYNALVLVFEENNLMELTPLNPKGLCDGLGKLFLFYNKQARSNEFKFFLAFISSLNAASIKDLVQIFQKNKNPALGLPHQNKKQKNKIAALDTNDQFNKPTFNKLIEFIEGVNKTQNTQRSTRFKSIGANWESTHMICCVKEELAQSIQKSRVLEIETGESKIITTFGHTTSLYISNENAEFYNSNRKKGVKICHNEDMLAKELDVALNKYTVAVLFISTLSYGDEKRELDDLLDLYKPILSTEKSLQDIVLKYKEGQLARQDTAAALYYQLTQQENNQVESSQLKKDLKNYLEMSKKDSVCNVISNNMSVINNKVNMFEITPLTYACANGYFEIVRDLLFLEADNSIKDLFYATLTQHEEVKLLIKQHRALKKITDTIERPTNKITFAQELSGLFDAYAHPGLFSTFLRSHRLLAAEIAETLKDHSNWGAYECATYLAVMTKDIDLNQADPFKSLIDHAHKKIEVDLGICTVPSLKTEDRPYAKPIKNQSSPH